MTDVLLDKGYHNIAVYGAGKHGTLFIGDIDLERVRISYIIDKNRTEPIHGIGITKPGEHMEGIDAVIVTPLIEIETLQYELETQADLISMYDLIGD